MNSNNDLNEKSDLDIKILCKQNDIRYTHSPLTTSDIWCWSGGRGILTELSLSYSGTTSSYRSVNWIGLLFCLIWRKMLSISWREHHTNDSILTELAWKES